MAVANGPNIGLMSFALPGDAFYLDINRFNRWVDFFLQPRVISYALGTPPGSPANGDTYLVPNGGGTGVWAGNNNRLARWTTEITTPAWEFVTAKTGWEVYDLNTSTRFRFNGTLWIAQTAVDRNVVSALSIAAGVVNIDCALGDYFTLALTANVTSITFSNLPAAGKAASLAIRITQDPSTPRTVAWPASFRWDSAGAQSVSTGASAVDELAITTFDQGTKWDATLSKGRV